MPAPLLADRFELLEPHRQGGTARVYRGIDRQTGRAVAVKLMLGDGPEDEARFERGAALLARLASDGIARHVAHGRSEGTLYLVEEWVPGDTLRARLGASGFTLAEALDVALQIAGALAEPHRLGYVHRDVTPENIVFCDPGSGTLKLVDFGAARDTDRDVRLTATGTVVGTPGYMAPEQALGRRDVDARADVFALGCVLFECAGGWPAFSGESFMALRTKVLAAEPPPLRERCPEAPDELLEVLGRLLAKDPARRPPDAGAVAGLLAKVPRPAGPRRRAPEMAGLVTVAGARAALGTGVILAGTPEAGDTFRPDALDALERLLGQTVAGLGADVSVLADGVVLARAAGDDATLARLALALRPLLPRRAMVVAAGGGEGDALAWAAQELELETARLEAGNETSGRAIRLHPALARALEGAYPLLRHGGRLYLPS